MRDPQVFLFDEPLSNLDAKLRVQMRAELKDIHARLKTTTIYVTHDQIEAMTMADSIVAMRDGVVEQMGDPLTLYDRPANMFGRRLHRLARDQLRERPGRRGRRRRDLRGRGRHALAHRSENRPPGGRRAGHLCPAPRSISRSPSEGDGLPARVSTVEPTGSETHVVATIGAATVTAVLRERVSARVGETIWLRPMAESAHLFDTRTTARIAAA